MLKSGLRLLILPDLVKQNFRFHALPDLQKQFFVRAACGGKRYFRLSGLSRAAEYRHHAAVKSIAALILIAAFT